MANVRKVSLEQRLYCFFDLDETLLNTKMEGAILRRAQMMRVMHFLGLYHELGVATSRTRRDAAELPSEYADIADAELEKNAAPSSFMFRRKQEFESFGVAFNPSMIVYSDDFGRANLCDATLQRLYGINREAHNHLVMNGKNVHILFGLLNARYIPEQFIANGVSVAELRWYLVSEANAELKNRLIPQSLFQLATRNLAEEAIVHIGPIESYEDVKRTKKIGESCRLVVSKEIEGYQFDQEALNSLVLGRDKKNRWQLHFINKSRRHEQLRIEEIPGLADELNSLGMPKATALFAEQQTRIKNIITAWDGVTIIPRAQVLMLDDAPDSVGFAKLWGCTRSHVVVPNEEAKATFDYLGKHPVSDDDIVHLKEISGFNEFNQVCQRFLSGEKIEDADAREAIIESIVSAALCAFADVIDTLKAEQQHPDYIVAMRYFNLLKLDTGNSIPADLRLAILYSLFQNPSVSDAILATIRDQFRLEFYPTEENDNVLALLQQGLFGQIGHILLNLAAQQEKQTVAKLTGHFKQQIIKPIVNAIDKGKKLDPRCWDKFITLSRGSSGFLLGLFSSGRRSRAVSVVVKSSGSGVNASENPEEEEGIKSEFDGSRRHSTSFSQ